MLEQQIEADIKTALLAGEKDTATTLRGLKSVLLYAKVAGGTRDEAMSDADVITLLRKEAKKRQESAELYIQGGSQDRADKELAEKALIEAYLPAQLDEAAVAAIVAEVVTEQGATSLQQMGPVIAAVKQRIGADADGSLIARLVKEKLA